ncbi:MAG: sporulation protein YunB [bacterium]|jgi:sporulation protein YunB
MRRSRRRKMSLPTFLLLFSLIFLGAFAWFERELKPVVVKVAEATARSVALRAINMAVQTEIGPHIQYENLILVRTDTDGNIVLMQPNTPEITRLAGKTAVVIGDTLQELADAHLSIPFGQVMGSQLFANVGPRIKLRLFPIGAVQPVFVDEFEQAGINQTRHRISINIEAVIRIVMPGITRDVPVNQIIPVSEAVIVGRVPSSYLQFSFGQGN